LARTVINTASLQNLEMMTCDKMLYVLFHFNEKFKNFFGIGLRLDEYLTPEKAIAACELSICHSSWCTSTLHIIIYWGPSSLCTTRVIDYIDFSSRKMSYDHKRGLRYHARNLTCVFPWSSIKERSKQLYNTNLTTLNHWLQLVIPIM
jgi:hypothetical protein